MISPPSHKNIPKTSHSIQPSVQQQKQNSKKQGESNARNFRKQRSLFLNCTTEPKSEREKLENRHFN